MRKVLLVVGAVVIFASQVMAQAPAAAAPAEQKIDWKVTFTEKLPDGFSSPAGEGWHALHYEKAFTTVAGTLKRYLVAQHLCPDQTNECAFTLRAHLALQKTNGVLTGQVIRFALVLSDGSKRVEGFGDGASHRLFYFRDGAWAELKSDSPEYHEFKD